MGWSLAVDRGGTFTDAVGVGPDGLVRTAKVLSEVSGRSDDAITAAVRAVVEPAGATLDDVDSLRIGTTVATNALLTRTGARTALVTTRGLGDLAWIRDQSRPELFALRVERPEPIAAMVIEADERLSVDGQVLIPLDEGGLRDRLAGARAAGMESVAVCLVHGWMHEEHERAAARIAREVGFEEVVTSADAPLRGFVSRLATLSADAALTPILHRGLRPVARAFGTGRILCMQSGGGLVGLARFRGVRALLSGPAGGVIGARAVARRGGFGRAVAFDMGGTSTDVAWLGAELERFAETRIAGERLAEPMLGVHTIAAGGGSVCRFDGGRLRVGPESAGADPGPACYRRGGPCTVTDCNIVLGRVPVSRFPAVFGPGEDQGPSDEASREAVESVGLSLGGAMAIEQVAEGCLAIAVEATAAAVRKISIEQGRDLAEAAFVAFGGAGGQIACRVAEAIGVRTVLFHPRAGVLSAWGIACAERRALRRRSVEVELSPAALREVEESLGVMEREARAELGGGGRCERRVTLRSRDWDRGVLVGFGPMAEMTEAFCAACRKRYGFDPGPDGAVIASAEVEAIAEAGFPNAEGEAGGGETSAESTRVFFGGRWCEVPVVARGALSVGRVIDGPAMVLEDGATVVIDPGWRAEVMDDGTLRCDRVGESGVRVSSAEDPVLLAVFGHRFRAIADEMGAVLRATARSVNIRERLDFSCAVFDAAGSLIANGEHMPVHLGSMGESVRHVIAAFGDRLGPDDAVLLNDPYHGGTHLPDLTLVSPVFVAGESRFFVASRGHHADIGGVAPGSMAPGAKTLEEEGVVIDGFVFREGGRMRTAELRALLGGGRYPCRAPDRVIDDLRAQLAANQRGIEGLLGLAGEYGVDVVADQARRLQVYAEAAVRRLVRTLRPGEARVPTDGGGEIRLRVDIDGDGAVFDFSGTSRQRGDALNAPPAVTHAAVLYAIRCLLDDDIPLNEGCLRAARIQIPEGCVLRPRPGAAVAGGNVETSQLVVDALFAAMGVLANSQGTMNNLSFGDEGVQYYETICGGLGAGAGFAGASAVQGHMTNSRLTDPEVLESRFPVRLWRFGRRAGSGGGGRWHGGDGAVREIEFLRPMTVSMLAGRRETAPAGGGGGGAALVGTQHAVSNSGETEPLTGQWTREFGAGERLVIETPGGGGWGPAD